jgi:hypothetical protein
VAAREIGVSEVPDTNQPMRPAKVMVTEDRPDFNAEQAYMVWLADVQTIDFYPKSKVTP